MSHYDQFADDELTDGDFREESQAWVNFISFMYYFIQVLLLLTGTSVLYYCASIFWRSKGSPAPDMLWMGLLRTGIVIGCILIVYSIFGMVTLALKSRRLATIYLIVTLILVFASIGQIWYVQAKLQELAWQMSSIWDGLSDSSKTLLQSFGRCCGYSDTSDRVVAPCKLAADTIGCFPVGEPSPVIEWLRSRLLIALSIEFMGGLILSVLTVFLVFVHDPLVSHASPKF